MRAPALWDAGYRGYWAARDPGMLQFEPLKSQPPGPWSDCDRRRRSRIDWSALVDDTLLVNRQEGFERNATVLAMRDAGLSREEIADCIGVTGSRVHQIIRRAERQRGKPSPIEAYLRRGLDDVAPLVGTLHRLRTGDWRAP